MSSKVKHLALPLPIYKDFLFRCVHPSTDDRTYRPDKWIVLPSSQAFHCDIVETSCKWGQLREGFLHSQIHEDW